ncbi:MAG: polyprenol monophosphomannose synthase [Brevinematales bacterium]|nr:polyprenol monophosphomannose synthase [Brevinematales bacterium]
MKYLVIIPTYNEAMNIEKLIEKVLKQSNDIDVLVVDDNSPDGTANIVEKIMEKNKRVNLLKREKKSGLGRAYVTGFKWALQKGVYDYIFEMDADFSHDPDELYLFFQAITEGYDVVCGSRYIEGLRVLNWDLKRLFLSLGGNIYARIITGVKLTDLTGGYNCYSKKVLSTINLDKISSNGYSFQIEMKAKSYYKGFKIKEVPITFRDRYEGTTKMSGGIINEALFKCFKIRFEKWFGKY